MIIEFFAEMVFEFMGFVVGFFPTMITDPQSFHAVAQIFNVANRVVDIQVILGNLLLILTLSWVLAMKNIFVWLLKVCRILV